VTGPGRLVYRAGLVIYDLLATQWSHKAYTATEFQMLAPQHPQNGLEGGLCFGDAQTNDARLVLRVIREARCRRRSGNQLRPRRDIDTRQSKKMTEKEHPCPE